MKNLRLWLLAALIATATPTTVADDSLSLALAQAARSATSFKDEFQAQVWLADMSRRLQRWLPDPIYRLELLKTVHEEAMRFDLDPELVLAVMQVESAFDRYAVSHMGAQGLMQVMPFWKKEIGHPRDNLFQPETNIRYGCTVLKHYLDHTNGNVQRALARYNGSVGKKWYPRLVFRALHKRWRSS